jgi:hypothetical protein
MLFSCCVHTFSADADEAPAAEGALRAPADQLDTKMAFVRQLGIARRAALTQPAVAAKLLSAWVACNG